MKITSSLQHRPFALLWAGQSMSRLGDSLYRIALVWWVLEKTGSPEVLGTLLIFSFAPQVIFLLIGGIAADRLPRIRVMFASDVLRGLVVGVIALLAALNTLEVWHLFAASFLFGMVQSFFEPSYVSIMPEMLPSEFLPSGNSLTQMSGQISGIIGPALGAFIVKIGGTPTAFALDALSFFFAAVMVVGMLRTLDKRESHPASTDASSDGGTKRGTQRVMHDLREGLDIVFKTPWLWITIAIFAFTNITVSGPMSIALPFLIKDTLHLDVDTFGLLNSLAAVGAIVGAVWIGRSTRIRRRGILAYGAEMVTGACVLAFGLPISIYGLLVAAFGFGLSSAIFGLVWINTLQEMVPKDKLGRVSSVDQLGSFGLLPIGFGITGILTKLFSAPTIFIVGGASTLLLLALGLWQPAIRNLD